MKNCFRPVNGPTRTALAVVILSLCLVSPCIAEKPEQKDLSFFLLEEVFPQQEGAHREQLHGIWHRGQCLVTPCGRAGPTDLDKLG